jgi:HK97 family phage prohead protease
MSLLEIRTATQAIEPRGTSSKRKLVGHAAVFDSPALIAGLFTEKIQLGAFAESLARNDVLALFNHNHDSLLGRTKAGTLRLSEDSRGLLAEIDAPDTTLGQDLVTLIERGDISGWSFGFVVLDEDWDDSREMPLRVLKKIDLHEVSVCISPAYEATDLAVRVTAAFSAAAVAARLRMDLATRIRGIAA